MAHLHISITVNEEPDETQNPPPTATGENENKTRATEAFLGFTPNPQHAERLGMLPFQAWDREYPLSPEQREHLQVLVEQLYAAAEAVLADRGD